MRKIIYISVLLFSFLSAAQAQKKFIYEDTALLQKEEIEAPVEEIKLDDNTIVQSPVQTYEQEKADTVLYPNNLQVSYDSIMNWKNLKAYAYSRYLDSLLKKQKKEEVKQETPRSSGPGFFDSILGSGLVSVLLWTLAIFFILFIIYRLFLADGVFKRSAKTIKKQEDDAVEEEVTNESDFNALIRTALQHGNYRQAVRYQYLRTLHMLADKNFIELAPDKTNYQYVSEIKNRDKQMAFAGITLNYEYVWYGEFNIDKNIYHKIETGFTSLNQTL